MIRPKPVPQYIICSVCDLSWADHGENPTLMDCIKLLKAQAYTPHPKVWYYSNAPYSTTTANVSYRTPKEN